MPCDHTESRQHDDENSHTYPEGQRTVAGWHAAPGAEHDEPAQGSHTQEYQSKPVPTRHCDGVSGHWLSVHFSSSFPILENPYSVLHRTALTKRTDVL